MNIIITGASKGIGFAIAKAFAIQPEQHAIGMCSRHQEELSKAEDDLRKLSPHQKFFSKVCDVSGESDIASFVSAYENTFGAVDALINNAGFGILKSVLDLSKKEFESVLATNLRGPFLLTRAVLPNMRERKSGTIVTIGSLAGKNGFKGGAAYCASKYAVRGMMQCLFQELREENIRFVTINPGSVDSDFYQHNEHPNGIRNKLPSDEVAECVAFAVKFPQSADLSDLDIRPTNPDK